MRTILHCDANNFFASVECFLNPDLKGKCIAVTGDADKRHGIILAKNDNAKKYGVKTGEAIWEAQKKCPSLVLTPTHFDEYTKFSKKLFAIYSEYTDRVEPFGIDECWLDVTESCKILGCGEKIANELRSRIKKEIGITISVGVSFNKIFAKLGSDMKKPDATTIITCDDYKTKVWSLPVKDMLMIGQKTNEALARIGIYTIGDLANAPEIVLKMHFGVNGIKYKAYANGDDMDEVKLATDKRIAKSIGNSTTMPKDIVDRNEACAVVMALSDVVATRLRSNGFSAYGVQLGLKFNDFSYKSKQNTTNTPISSATNLCDSIMRLYDEMDKKLPIRMISVSTFDFLDSSVEATFQMSMFDTPMVDEKKQRLDSSIDELRKKYGYNVLKSALVLEYPQICQDLENEKHKDD